MGQSMDRNPRDGAQDQSASEDVFVARQPVFDDQERVWGYELLFRTSGTARTANVQDADMATIRVIADGYLLASGGMKPGQKALVNFPQRLLVEDAGFALPPDRCIIEILEDVLPEPEVVAAVERLKKAGYTLAIDDFLGQPALMPFLPFVSIVKVDILGLENDLERIRAVAQDLKKHDLALLAEKVEDLETFRATRDMGFSLFQGFFFSKPEIIPGKKVSANQVSKLQLLQELGKEDLAFPAVSNIIKTDPSLSYRLFKYVNMASQGFAQRIDSVERAVMLLGQRQLVQWLRAIILSDLSPSKKASELAFISVDRGRFLERVAERDRSGALQAETMFLLGMFSVLDAMLGQSMDSILEHLPLNAELRAALSGERSPLSPWLELVRAYESGDWDRAQSLAGKLGLKLTTTDRLYVQALTWTQSVMESAGEKAPPKPARHTA